jgi:hypothetical protein
MRLAIDRHTPTWLIGATVLVYLASAGAGFVLGFGFVRNAQGGAFLGAVVGVNAALFCTLLADWLLTRLVRQPQHPR